MQGNSKARIVNGIISAIIVGFFIVHAALGGLEIAMGFSGALAWLVWLGMACICGHIAVSIVTSWEQLSDTERPPSRRKKRHLVLKWVTGGLLALAVCTHIIAVRTGGASAISSSTSASLLLAALAIVLAVHICIGSKSLLKDLSINRRYKMAFRIVVSVLIGAFALVAIIIPSIT